MFPIFAACGSHSSSMFPFCSPADRIEKIELPKKFLSAFNVAGMITSDERRLRVFRQIILKMTEAHECVSAHTLALKYFQGGDKNEVLKEMAKVLVNTDQFDKAIAIAEEIRGFGKDEIFHLIAVRMAKLERIDDAFRVAKGINSAHERDSALLMVVEKATQAHEVKKALSYVPFITLSSQERNGAFVLIAKLMAESYEFSKALHLVESNIDDDLFRGVAFCYIGIEEAKIGQFPEALALAERARLVGVSQAMASVVSGLVVSNAVEQAIYMAEGQGRTRNALYEAIVKELINKGESDQAISVLRRMPSYVGDLPGLIAEGMCQVQRFDEALTLVRGMPEDSSLVGSYICKYGFLERVVSAMAKAGKCVKALDAIREIPEEYRSYKDRSFFAVAMTLIEQKLFDDANRVIAQIIDVHVSDNAKALVARSLAIEGFPDDAYRKTSPLHDCREVQEAFVAIAKGFTEKDCYQKAFDVADGIGDKECRKKAFDQCAAVMTRGGHIQEMIDLTKKNQIFDSSVTERIYVVIAEELTKIGRYKDALAIIMDTKFSNRDARDVMLLSIAQELAEKV